MLSAEQAVLMVVVNKDSIMAKYGPKAQEKVEKTVDEFNKGELKNGGNGQKVTSRKQAVAIGLSEARKAGAKVPKQSK